MRKKNRKSKREDERKIKKKERDRERKKKERDREGKKKEREIKRMLPLLLCVWSLLLVRTMETTKLNAASQVSSQ